jgi:hypothetical protein
LSVPYCEAGAPRTVVTPHDDTIGAMREELELGIDLIGADAALKLALAGHGQPVTGPRRPP